MGEVLHIKTEEWHKYTPQDGQGGLFDDTTMETIGFFDPPQVIWSCVSMSEYNILWGAPVGITLVKQPFGSHVSIKTSVLDVMSNNISPPSPPERSYFSPLYL